MRPGGQPDLLSITALDYLQGVFALAALLLHLLHLLLHLLLLLSYGLIQLFTLLLGEYTFDLRLYDGAISGHLGR